jgi:hypothetical protein
LSEGRHSERHHGLRAFRLIVLGLPDTLPGCLFDVDEVLTQTAKIHAAWRAMFDPYLRSPGSRRRDSAEVVIESVVAEREHLAARPVPDTFMAGARALGLEPAQAACQRTRSPACKPDGRDASAYSSASAASTGPTCFVRTGRT